MKGSGTKQYVQWVLRRFTEDGCMQSAASLSFTSLLALTPVLAITFAILSAFPAFEGMADRIESIIFNSFVPAAGETVRTYVRGFVKNALHSTLFGVTALGLTSILLLFEIQQSFKKIWKWRGKRTRLHNLMVFWATLTLGPLLLGVSLSLSSYLFAGVRFLDSEWAVEISSAYLVFLPLFMEWFAFFLMYVLVPDAPIRWRYSILGAVFTTMLFEILKAGFALYVYHFPFYEVLYGTLATVPLILLWLYLSWAAILLGAQVVATLPQRNHFAQAAYKSASLTRRLFLAVKILEICQEGARQGSKTTQENILRRSRGSQSEVQETLQALEAKGYLAFTNPPGYVLCRDLTNSSLFQLMSNLEIILEEKELDGITDEWAIELKALLREMQNNQESIFSMPLSNFFSCKH